MSEIIVNLQQKTVDLIFNQSTREVTVDVTTGPAGKSAYEVAVQNGFPGTESQWLSSLIGDHGDEGKSAYEVAVLNGYSGTLSQWLTSLIGDPGDDGKSAYDIAVQYGFSGTESQWLTSLIGDPGDDGKSAYEVAVQNGFSGTEIQWLTSLIGDPGDDGKSAYEVAVQNGYTGTLSQWLTSLVGPAGPTSVSTDANNFSKLGVDGKIFTPKSLQLIGTYSSIVSVTGTTTETQFSGVGISIPANTLSVRDSLMIYVVCTVNGVAATKALTFRIGTSLSPSPVTGSASIGGVTGLTASAGWLQFTRKHLLVASATQILYPNPGTADDNASASGQLFANVDISVNNWLIPTCTLGNAADRVTIQKLSLFKY